jgi:excisionase family DNA binding protein
MTILRRSFRVTWIPRGNELPLLRQSPHTKSTQEDYSFVLMALPVHKLRRTQNVGSSLRREGAAAESIFESHLSWKPARSTFLNSADVAQWLGISTRTVCLWAELQEIPAFKIGHQWRFREEEIRRWLTRAATREVSGSI